MSDRRARPVVYPTPYWPLGWKRKDTDFRNRGGWRGKRKQPAVIPQPDIEQERSRAERSL